MFLAEEAAKSASAFTWFDPFVILFTIVIAIGVFRQLAAPKKNYFAIGFGIVALLVFMFMDVIMIKGWMG
ncbi:hypothetical protein [Paenibacillus sp. YYML68]|uniref:hypothetical protein n=1 Tax=Paenibacillus sp. YYML68 TaxID=2909250 RepID=UPI00249238CA|nr:hypothetical protein [Paenibacillus sp. YYML68]